MLYTSSESEHTLTLALDHTVTQSMRLHYKTVSILIYALEFYICCFLLAPASPPSDPTATVESSTSITVSWLEVPAIDQNGIIIEYEVEYTQNTFDININQSVMINSTTVELTDLHEYAQYFIRVRAYTSIGSGPYTTAINVTTAQDGKNIAYFVS